MENANPPPYYNSHNFPVAARATFTQEPRELGAITALINSRYVNVETYPHANMINVDDDRSIDTPLEPLPSDPDSELEDGEVVNSSYMYGSDGTLMRRRVINGHNLDELAFECRIGYMGFVPYFDPFLPMNIITRKAYNTIMVEQLEETGTNLVGIAKDLCVFIGSLVYVVSFVVLEDIGDFILSSLADVVVGRPFMETTNLDYDCEKGIISFEWLFEKCIYQMPRTLERFKKLGPINWNRMPPHLVLSDRDLMSGLKHPHEKSREMYKHCLELGPDYQVNETFKEWLIRGHVSFYEGTWAHD